MQASLNWGFRLSSTTSVTCICFHPDSDVLVIASVYSSSTDTTTKGSVFEKLSMSIKFSHEMLIS